MLWGPANMPRPVAEALNRALVTTLRDPVVRDRMLLAGHAPVQGENTLESARAYMIRELAEVQRMVDLTGVRLQP
jgi:tripartite-type tricarboxylate transporter receptor subunit TctC